MLPFLFYFSILHTYTTTFSHYSRALFIGVQAELRPRFMIPPLYRYILIGMEELIGFLFINFTIHYE